MPGQEQSHLQEYQGSDALTSLRFNLFHCTFQSLHFDQSPLHHTSGCSIIRAQYVLTKSTAL
jgi:hypothetical protein